jgi:hypothetical protein
MLTMGYSFRPWTNPKAISPGDEIRKYISATARDGHRPTHPLSTYYPQRCVVLTRKVDGRVECIA